MCAGNQSLLKYRKASAEGKSLTGLGSRCLSYTPEASMDSKVKNQMMYLAMWQMINKLALEGAVAPEVLERLNRKNAETLMCDILPIEKSHK